MFFATKIGIINEFGLPDPLSADNPQADRGFILPPGLKPAGRSVGRGASIPGVSLSSSCTETSGCHNFCIFAG
jgi:hypothetical protein